MTYTILVCDDDQLIVNSIAIHLQKEGYRVIRAYNGLEALEAVGQQEIHLILLDVMMPQLDGLFVLDRRKTFLSLCYLLKVRIQIKLQDLTLAQTII